MLAACPWHAGTPKAVVQGLVDPDEYQVFKPLLGERKVKPIIEKKLGAKARKIVYASGARTELERGKGLEVFVMCEIPSNVILAEEFAQRFDGFSIGSNDLTQLVLGVDRDNAELKKLFDERNPALTSAVATLLEKAHRTGTKTGICGEAPSNYPEFARFLVEHGIDSISVAPDSFIAVKRAVAEAEAAHHA